MTWLAFCLGTGAGWAGMPPPTPRQPASPPPCSIRVPTPEPADLTALAKIPAAAALPAALAAYPGTRVQALALENENGCLVYRVSLSNGLEIHVDAGTGRIIRSTLEEEEETPE